MRTVRSLLSDRCKKRFRKQTFLGLTPVTWANTIWGKSPAFYLEVYVLVLFNHMRDRVNKMSWQNITWHGIWCNNQWWGIGLKHWLYIYYLLAQTIRKRTKQTISDFFLNKTEMIVTFLLEGNNFSIVIIRHNY